MENKQGLKRGRKPLSKKKAIETQVTFYGDMTALPLDVKKELEDNGLVARWVDAKQMKEWEGYHRSGWQVYRRPENVIMKMKEDGPRFGRDPDGFVRRGTLILAAKTKEENERHKQHLARRARTYSSQHRKQQADELRQQARAGGLNTTIVDSYED